MLKQLSVKNFTVFTEASLEFGTGLNVIVGENGCGKSHLLKVVYSMIANRSEEAKNSAGSEPTKTIIQKTLAEKLIHVMRPESLGRLASRTQGRSRCEVGVVFSEPQYNCKISFSTSSKTGVHIDQLPSSWQEKPPVYFPTRELLT